MNALPFLFIYIYFSAFNCEEQRRLGKTYPWYHQKSTPTLWNVMMMVVVVVVGGDDDDNDDGNDVNYDDGDDDYYDDG